MDNAYIYFDGYIDGYSEGYFGKDYSGEGPYVLVFNGEVIANHFCSSRSWAEHDLVYRSDRQELLAELNINKVISNGRIVWDKVISNESNERTKNN